VTLSRGNKSVDLGAGDLQKWSPLDDRTVIQVNRESRFIKGLPREYGEKNLDVISKNFSMFSRKPQKQRLK